MSNPHTTGAADPSHEFVVRPSVEQDVEQISVLLQPFVQQRKLVPRTDEELQHLFRTGFVAERDTRIVGSAAIEIYSKKLAEIQCLAVSPECQGYGVGKKLVAACVDLARNHGVLEVMAISASEDFLKSCGFHFALPDQKKALFYQPQDER